MLAILLPLRAILFQALFLLVAIAIESFILHKRLYLSRRMSIEYAASLNLFSTVCGWTLFFLVEPLMPVGLREQMVNFIFFSDFAPHLDFSVVRVYFNIGVFSLLSFALVFAAESVGLNFLIKLAKANLFTELAGKDAEPSVDDRDNLYYVIERYKTNSLLLANLASQSLSLFIPLLLQRYK